MHQETSKRRRRRYFSPEYKASLVHECLSGGASLSSIAVDNGINPNVLRRWVIEHERLGKYSLDAAVPTIDVRASDASPALLSFVPVKTLDAVSQQNGPTHGASQCGQLRQRDERTVRIDLRAKSIEATIHWPQEQTRDLANWLRDLLR